MQYNYSVITVLMWNDIVEDNEKMLRTMLMIADDYACTDDDAVGADNDAAGYDDDNDDDDDDVDDDAELMMMKMKLSPLSSLSSS